MAWLEELAFDSVGGVISEEMTTTTCGEEQAATVKLDENFVLSCGPATVGMIVPKRGGARIRKISAETKRLRKLSQKRQDARSRHAAKMEAAELAGSNVRCAYMLSWAKRSALLHEGKGHYRAKPAETESRRRQSISRRPDNTTRTRRIGR